MSVVFECDRCGGRMMGRPSFQFKMITGKAVSEAPVDLCENCQDLLVRLMNEHDGRPNEWRWGR